MSWQSYVDDHLIASGNVTQATIIGVKDVDVWAQSPGFEVRAAHAHRVSRARSAPSSALDAPRTRAHLSRHAFADVPSTLTRVRARRPRARACARQVSPDEAKALIAGFSDATALQANGIFANKEKYMFIKCTDGKEILGKKARARVPLPASSALARTPRAAAVHGSRARSGGVQGQRERTPPSMSPGEQSWRWARSRPHASRLESAVVPRVRRARPACVRLRAPRSS